MAIKVSKLANGQGLMAIVPILEWEKGMRALIDKASRKGIVPSCIVLTRLVDTAEDETMVYIVLWGDR